MVLSSIISAVSKKAADLVLGEFRTAMQAEEYCKKLCRILPAVQAVVEDAEKRSTTEPAVRGWMLSLKDTALEAEDVLDELKYDAISKVIETEIQAESEIQSESNMVAAYLSQISLLVCSLFKKSKTSYFDGKRLKGVLDKVDVIVAEMNQFGFLKTQQPVTVINRPKSISLVNESTIIGRNDDLNKIVAVVLSQAERERIAVLPIVGMGGLGKTTLAQLVYNCDKIQKHFQLKLWVCVSDEFHVNHLAKSIIDLAIGKDCKVPLDNPQLISQWLRIELRGKRYLLVLDDVWNEIPSIWEQLRLLLDCGNPGSVVIVTTRSQKVALVVSTMEPHNLQGLNEDDLWGIFRQKAFQLGVDERPNLIEIGKQLMKKCCGSPLVATTLGGLMSYKKEEREWLDVLESDSLKVENEIMSVLKLSYQNLPSHMKRCFAFCAVYPKDYEMDRDTLIQLWMENSYIPSEGGMEMEAKGMEIFNELAWRGFFQDIRERDDDVLCKMHDLIHDLAQSLVGKACVSISDSVQQSDKLSNETFHVSSSSIKGVCDLFKEFSSSYTILLLSNNNMANNRSSVVAIDLSTAKSCRALCFRTIPVKIHAEPETLKHLRYLDLSYCNLEVIAESLSTSYNLQTLILTGCSNLISLPEGMRHMRSLRHVYLERCDKLNRMPAGLGKLSCLQTLTSYIVDPATGCNIEELKNLHLGGLLELRGLEKVGNQREAKLANLTLKSRLKHLGLYWGISVDPDSARDVLKGLEPYRALQTLEIYNYNGIQFVAWMHNSKTFRNLTKFKLNNCQQCTILWPIWKLPSLEVLQLDNLKSLKHICNGSMMLAQRQGDENRDSRALHMFPKLQVLELSGLDNLERWQENDDAEQTTLALPQLSRLAITDCPELNVEINSKSAADLARRRIIIEDPN